MMILPSAFLYEKAARVIFYWCGYLSLVGILLKSKRNIFLCNRITLSFLILSILFFLWSTLSFTLSNEKISELLFAPSKRWFVASIISIYIFNSMELIAKKNISNYIIMSLLIAFISSTIFSIYQETLGIKRITLGNDRATLTAYAYSVLTLALISLVANYTNIKNKILIIPSILLISIHVIFLTQTRSAMVIHPALGFLLLFTYIIKTKKSSLIVFSLLTLSILAISAFNIKTIITRYDETKQEISYYDDGNDFTSLGSRISMWKFGVAAFKESPFGQSQSHRNFFILSTIIKNKTKSAASEFLEVHLHNEFIQYASIFGIAGIIILLYFFYSMCFKVDHYKAIGPIGISSVAVLLYGATDVLLTSIEFIVIYSITTILCYITQKNMRREYK